jgi:hypothetical protein
MILDSLLYQDLNALCDKYGITGVYGVFISSNGKWSDVALSRPLGKYNVQTTVNALSHGSAYLSGMADSFRLLNNNSFKKHDSGKNGTVDETEMPH